MATNGLGCLIMTAVIDQGFRERLLAAPAEVMGDFELTNDEREALTSIQAGSFTEFAARLYRWLEQRDPLHLGLRGDDSSSGGRREELRRDSTEIVESAATTHTGHPAMAMPDSRPLCVATSQAMQPRRHIVKEPSLPYRQGEIAVTDSL